MEHNKAGGWYKRERAPVVALCQSGPMQNVVSWYWTVAGDLHN
jgi:hypothetical protein